LHDLWRKEKSDEISLIETMNATNNELLVNFPTKSSGASTIFTHHQSRAKVSNRYFVVRKDFSILNLFDQEEKALDTSNNLKII